MFLLVCNTVSLGFLFVLSVTGVQAQFHRTTCTSVGCVTSAGGKAKEMKPRAPTKPETQLTLLEIPPVNTEPECRYLSYDEMEEAGNGKQFRGRRRRKKNKDSALEWKENCCLVRSGDAAIDKHCLPTAAEGDMGAGQSTRLLQPRPFQRARRPWPLPPAAVTGEGGSCARGGAALRQARAVRSGSLSGARRVRQPAGGVGALPAGKTRVSNRVFRLKVEGLHRQQNTPPLAQ